MRNSRSINDAAATGRSRMNDSIFGFLLLDRTRLHHSLLFSLNCLPKDPHLAAGPAHRLAARASRCHREEYL